MKVRPSGRDWTVAFELVVSGSTTFTGGFTGCLEAYDLESLAKGTATEFLSIAECRRMTRCEQSENY